MMRLALAIVILFFLLSPAGAGAQTPMSKDTANAYYQACMSHTDKRMSTQGQEALCSCTAVKMMSEMTLEDLAGMSAKPGPGRAAYDKMLTNVYAPCMKIPVEDEINAECMRDHKINELMLRDKDKLCQCMAGEAGDYMDKNMKPVMQSILRYHPDVTDIFPALVNNSDIRGYTYQKLTACLHDID